MQRRQFITLLGGAAAWPLAARAQQGERMRRIGVLMSVDANDQEVQGLVAALMQGLREADWIVSRNLQIDMRNSAGNVPRLRKDAEDLIASVLVTGVVDPSRHEAGCNPANPNTAPFGRNFLSEIEGAQRAGPLKLVAMPVGSSEEMERAIIEFAPSHGDLRARKDRGACASGIGAKAIVRQLGRKPEAIRSKIANPLDFRQRFVNGCPATIENTIRHKIVNAIGRQHDYRGAQSRARGGQDDSGGEPRHGVRPGAQFPGPAGGR
jgi:hypothetical protein